MVAARTYPTPSLAQFVAASHSAALRRLWRVCHALMGPIAAPFQPAVASAGVATPFYLKGGVALADCVAAYQPKGALSLADSYINRAHPGTNNAAPGVAPTWDVTNGWKFNGSSQYLNTGIIPVSKLWSMIVQFSGAKTSRNCICGCLVSTTQVFVLFPANTALKARYGSGGLLEVSPNIVTGNMCVAGSYGYRNGIIESGSTEAGTNVGYSIYIGTANLSGLGSYWSDAYVQALSIYNVTLTAAQVLAISNAMAAL